MTFVLKSVNQNSGQTLVMIVRIYGFLRILTENSLIPRFIIYYFILRKLGVSLMLQQKFVRNKRDVKVMWSFLSRLCNLFIETHIGIVVDCSNFLKFIS